MNARRPAGTAGRLRRRPSHARHRQPGRETGRGIRTPDQRVRVFISSTLQELSDRRRAARDAVDALRLVPVMFEMGARPHPPRQVYRAYLAQSQIFVGIYWQNYGWVAPEEETSGLEDEYRLSAGMPRLIYVKSPAPDRDSRLTDLLARIKADDSVSYQRFSDPAELQRLIENDLALLLSERFEVTRPPGRAPDAVLAGALPVPATPLVDRESEAAEVEDLVIGQGVRLIIPHRSRRGREDPPGRGGRGPARPPVRRRGAVRRSRLGAGGRPGAGRDRRRARAEHLGRPAGSAT